MKVSGFSFVKNAILYDYPIVEAIHSVLPLCDEFVVAVGKSEDETLALIRSIPSPKIKIIQTTWDENLRQGGKVLAVETDKAFSGVSKDADWAIYIQGDEVLHEDGHAAILQAMATYRDNPKVDGLLLNYLHFYGSYDYVGTSSRWYTHEIRVVKNDKSIYSYRDAQGFRKGNNKMLTVVPIEATVHHYGWVKEPEAMQRKQETFHKLWHDDAWVKQHISSGSAFAYESHLTSLTQFAGKHPKVMEERICAKNWKFDQDLTKSSFTLKDRIKRFLKNYIGINTYYQNYRILK